MHKSVRHHGTHQSGVSGLMVLLAVLLVVVGVVVYLFLQMGATSSDQTAVEVTGGQTEQPKTGLSALAALFQRRAAPTAVPTPTPIPVPSLPPLPLPVGPQEFTVTTGSEFVGPKFVRAWVSDFSTPTNVPQTVKVFIDKSTPATKVQGVLSTDTKNTPFTLTQQADENGQQTWQGQWVLTDTVERNFVFKFSADGPSGHSEFGLAAR